MQRAGLVAHDEDGPAHRYRPTASRREATGNLLTDFVNRFFRGSARRLVLGLVDAEQLSADDLRAIESKLDEAEPPPARPKPRTRKPSRRRRTS
jgi:predicted transcriptional regulator